MAVCLAVLALPTGAIAETRGVTDSGYTSEAARQRAARPEARCARRVGDAIVLSSDPACFRVLRAQVLDAIASLEVETAAQQAGNSRANAKRLPLLPAIPVAPWYYGQTGTP